ncbi:MAG: GyrI-like domain-containing protein [Reichenbachiella sp.]
MIDPRIENIKTKKFVGVSMNMSLEDNQTFKLWSSFMPQVKEITNRVTQDLVSLQVYEDGSHFKQLDPKALFTKWSLAEVADFSNIPEGLTKFELESGLYGVFTHHGKAELFPKTMGFILGMWLPHSKYSLDHRPHFELLGSKYKNDDPDSEEEIWIPLKLKD